MTPLTPRGPERRKEERRISPSIGEFAISEVARLKAENERLRKALLEISFEPDLFGKCPRIAREALKEQP